MRADDLTDRVPHVDQGIGPDPSWTPGAPRERILVIDDDENIRATIEEFLSLAGYRVEGAGGGREALDRLGTASYDLVISDLQMPDMDGLAVIGWIRETHPSLPVLVMTGHATVESSVQALRLGAYDYLLKPFRLDEVERTIENCLERRRLERRNLELVATNEWLHEVERIKDDLLAVVSHEFRTPLTGMKGFLRILRQGGMDKLGPDQVQAIEAIDDNVRRLDEMIANLLALVEAQGAAALPIREPARLGELVRDVLASVDLVRGRGRLEIDIAENARSAEVLVDRQRFPLVVTNLVDNAFKFVHEPGSAEVVVRVWRDDASVHLEVHDDGIGIPELLGEALFERFTQADMSSTREYQGAGLGLAVVREIVSAHGGQFRLVAPLLRGTSVRVTLPVADPNR